MEFGAFGLALMAALAVGFIVASRFSETVAGLMDRRDERINSIDGNASLAAGNAIIAAVLLAFVIEIARGEDGWPYSMLGAIGGVTYLGALLFYRLRQ